MKKTCKDGYNNCLYMEWEKETGKNACNYEGYCDYQLPKDSRPSLPIKDDSKPHNKQR